MRGKRFEIEKLDEGSLKKLSELGRLARGDILKMTTLAASGHPGGSMSSVDLYSKSGRKEPFHFPVTGLGSLIANVIVEHGFPIRFRKMGITQYGSSGKPDDLYRMQGLDIESLVQAVTEEIGKK